MCTASTLDNFFNCNSLNSQGSSLDWDFNSLDAWLNNSEENIESTSIPSCRDILDGLYNARDGNVD